MKYRLTDRKQQRNRKCRVIDTVRKQRHTDKKHRYTDKKWQTGFGAIAQC